MLEHRRLLSAAYLTSDPTTPDHPLWTIPRGSAVIDGVLNESAWKNAFEVYRSNPTSPGAAWVRMMYNDSGLFLGVEVEDANIWADGNGNGAGYEWELASDDSVVFFFDTNNSREQFMQASDFGIGVNVAPAGSPINGSGPVSRYQYIRGNGAGSAAGVIPGNYMHEGVRYATSVIGTINDPTDVDDRWFVEMFIPWDAIGMDGPPVHGQTMGMNFQIHLDGDGGPMNMTDNRMNPVTQFALPHFVDELIVGAHSSWRSTLPGFEGPASYAEVMFVDAGANSAPATVNDLSLWYSGEFGAGLTFTSPAGTLGGSGHVSGYEVRVSTSPINSEQAWASATVLENRYVPRLAGLEEKIRLAGLESETTYHLRVRAVDAAGNVGAMSNAITFTTLEPEFEGSKGRVIPSPMGGTFVHENGEAFVPVGDHIGISWRYTRHLFPGDIWDNVNKVYQPFGRHPEHYAYWDVNGYFQFLADSGVNTMRVYFELLGQHYEGNPNAPHGTYWVENQPGEYNEHTRQYIHNILELADQYGINIVISPFSTYWYDDSFGMEGPWSVANGGPLEDLNEFFQTPETLEIAKNRVTAVMGWVNESEHGHRVIGYEALSEWNDWNWTLNAGYAQHLTGYGREPEMAERARWIRALAQHMHDVDPRRLTMISTIARDPRGALARANFYAREFDVVVPHLYTLAAAQPHKNPSSDKAVLPALEQALFTNYYRSGLGDNRPVINFEWGTSPHDWAGGKPFYSSVHGYTLAEDDAMTRAVWWSGLASGQPGMALRINANELDWNGFNLTDGMRASQLTFRRFVDDAALGFDWTNYNARALHGAIRFVEHGSHVVHAIGSSDGVQGIAYVIQDRSVNSAFIQGSVLRLGGFDGDVVSVDVEFWSTLPDTTEPYARIVNLRVKGGEALLELPQWKEGLAIKFVGQRQAVPVSPQNVHGAVLSDGVVLLATVENGQRVTFVQSGDGTWVRYDGVGGESYDELVVGNFVAWRDAKDGRTYAAGSNVEGLVLLVQAHDGSWSSRNLTSEGGNREAIDRSLTFYTTPDNRFGLAGLSASGDLLLYFQQLTQVPGGGGYNWGFANLSESHFRARGIDPPVFVGELTAYTTSWDARHIAGLTADGDIRQVGWAPSPNFGPWWKTSNLTQIAGAPKLAGNISVLTPTSVGQINLIGTTPEGDVVRTYWQFGFGGTWITENLTQLLSTPRLVPETLTAYFTPWNAMQVAGVTSDNRLFVYGLRDEVGAAWAGFDLTPVLTPGIERPAGRLTSAVAPGAGINVLGRGESGDVVRLSWTRDALWQLENISENVRRGA